MYDICHPSYYHLCKLGCNDPIKTSTAFYVYIEICEVRRYWDVTYKYNQELDLIYFEVKKKKCSPLEIYVPWPTKYTISIDKIEKMQQLLQNERLTIVLKFEDSSSIFYTVTTGLLKPATPEASKQQKEKVEKILNLESEIQRNTLHLYELAKTLASTRETSDQTCNSNLGATVESSSLDSSLEIL
ncbi:tRNA-splicing endonuclease subunit Sen15-like [Pogonomyrmex barbatus]|uniref:tRNA-splicing endonuclease subunit Sen15-like n=1 Tax=Pogonomyrmex barbatus TaxID=144034 RepID=A0A6I9WNV5_9HYME|nr:tRNA-splicing endonuclease subunit Sen15-like [Pogonomyrmex barbatus]